MAKRDDPNRELGMADTMVALQAHHEATPTPPPAPRPPPPPSRSVWPIVVIAIAVLGAGVALAVFALRDGASHDRTAATPAPDASAPIATPTVAGSPEELVVLERAAIAKADEAALAALLAPDAFVIGVDAGEIATTGPAGAALLHTTFPIATTVTSTSAKIARDGDAAWIVDELDVGARHVMTSQLAFKSGALWRIAAWHVAILVPNPVAYRAAKDGTLPAPTAVADRPDDDHQVADAFRAAFASREDFIAAYSERPDAYDLGSAPREVMFGGATVKRAFSRIKPVIAIHDGVTAGRVGDRIGWAAANVDFTMTIDGADVTQTFRVLAILRREGATWKLVGAQWSNAGPM